uniref:Uncharacterized protein n=1 Tax=Arundo donax TaxID=35708 RepID=A0A0A8ZNV4_ARUDO
MMEDLVVGFEKQELGTAGAHHAALENKVHDVI